MAKNEVYVSKNLNSDGFWRDEIKLHQLHWINQAPVEGEGLPDSHSSPRSID